MQTDLRNKLLDLACEPYRATGKFNYYWARGKLGNDPMFAAFIDHGVFPDGARVLDLGCGRGLLAAWMLAAECLPLQDRFSASVNAPRGLRFAGVELIAREAECGNRALQPLHGDRVQLTGGDMRSANLDNADVITVLDVLHYIPYDEQNRMLDRIRAALGRGGLFVTRIGDANSGVRFALSQMVDRCVSFAQGHRLGRMWCRPLGEWIKALETRGFAVQTHPMSSGTPFANVLMISRATW